MNGTGQNTYEKKKYIQNKTNKQTNQKTEQKPTTYVDRLAGAHWFFS